MRRLIPVALVTGLVLAAVLVPPLSGQSGAKTVILPRGTTVESLAPGHFRLKLPEGCCLELKGYQKRKGTGTIEPGGSAMECQVKGAKGQLVALGGEVRLIGGTMPEGVASAAEAIAADFLKIEAEITWLPARLEFQATRVFNRLALAKLGPADAVAK